MKNFAFHFYNPFGWFFDWGNVFSPPAQPASKGVVLTADQTHTAKTGDVITGAAGRETVVLTAGVSRVSIDGKVETVTLSGTLFDYNLQPLGQKVTLTTGRFATTLATLHASTSGTQLAFADGSVVTLNLNGYGRAQVHYDTVQLLANRVTTLGNSDVTVRGANGNETLKLGAGLYNARVDPAVETVVLERSWQAAGVTADGSRLRVQDDDNQTVVEWTVAAGQPRTLEFSDAEGTVSLDEDGTARFDLTDVYLKPGEEYTASVSDIRIHAVDSWAWWFYGEPSVVTLGSGVHDVRIDDGIDAVVLPGNLADFRYRDSDGVLQIFDADGVTLLASVEITRNDDGVSLQFGDVDTRAVMTTAGVYLNDLAVSRTDPAELVVPTPSPETTDTEPTDTGGGFDYTLSLGNFGGYTARVEAVLDQALANMGRYITAEGSFDIAVLPQKGQNNVLAEAAPATVATPASLASQLNGADTGSVFQVEGLTGTDPNGSQADATVYINTTYLKSFNFDPETAPGANQYDLTTILTHELVHTLGFSGYLFDDTVSNRTAFDQWVSFEEGVPYFTGSNAIAIYGGRVPLAPESRGEGSAIYHIDVAEGSHLMGESLGRGDVRSLSALDLAMLEDIGIQIVGSLPDLA